MASANLATSQTGNRGAGRDTHADPTADRKDLCMRAILAVLAAGLIVQPASLSAQEIMNVSNMDQSCKNIYPGPSPSSDELKRVTFVNTRAEMVWPAWINLAGFVGVYPEEIPPGGSYTTYTRVGHRWMIIDGTNWNCVQRFTIQGDTGTYTIE